MVRIGSCADIFARRGDPWISAREADREYPLNRTIYADAEKDSFHESIRKARLKRENDALREKMGLSTAHMAPVRIATVEVNPDLDRFTQASKARERHDMGADKPRGKERTVAFARSANLNLKYGKKVAPIVQRQAPIRFSGIAAPSQKVTVRGYYVYVLYSDGTETETDWLKYKLADVSFRKNKRKKDVVLVEVWDWETGKLLLSYERDVR